MKSSPALRQALMQNIRKTLALLKINNAKNHDLYEIYAFSLLIESLKYLNATVQYCDGNGSATQKFVFRISPGSLVDKSGNFVQYTHAKISIPRPFPVNYPYPGNEEPIIELEAHVGIKASGQSNVLHESDVLLLGHAEAKKCRRDCVQPQFSKCLLLLECKCYTKASIGLGMAREFLGLRSDVRHCSTCFVILGSFSSHANDFLSYQSKRLRSGKIHFSGIDPRSASKGQLQSMQHELNKMILKKII